MCVLPGPRALPRAVLRQVIARRLVVATMGPTMQPGPASRRPPRSPGDDDTPPDPGVVRGDVIE